MDATKIGKAVSDIIKFVDNLDLKIDEKAAACRGAGDVFQQVIAAESLNIMLRESIKNYITNSMPKGE